VIVDELRIIGSTQTNVVMAAELTRVARRALQLRPPVPRKEGLGQLVYPFDRDLAWAAVTYLRTPTRVLWDVYRSRATRLEPLYDELVADILADQRALFRDGDGLSVEARRVEAFAAGDRQIVGTVKNALIDAAGRRGLRLHVDPAHPAVRWVARLDDRGELVVSIDLGGGSLSQRGWRRDAGEAPLREHLAAVLLMLCRFDPRTDLLVDPMCGSGTIPIEAVQAVHAVPRPTPALAALGISRAAPALYPDPSPSANAGATSGANAGASAHAGANAGASPGANAGASTGANAGASTGANAGASTGARPPLIAIGCDLDLGVLAAARDNSRAAGVADQVVWQRADVTSLRPDIIADIARERGRPAPGTAGGGTGLLLANPPYGERLDDVDLHDLYAALAETCRRFRGWRAGFLVGNPLLEQAFLPVVGQPRIKKPLANANLRAYFYLYEL
jgi:23S rRNA G2445 N2-methylase RlmL